MLVDGGICGASSAGNSNKPSPLSAWRAWVLLPGIISTMRAALAPAVWPGYEACEAPGCAWPRKLVARTGKMMGFSFSGR